MPLADDSLTRPNHVSVGNLVPTLTTAAQRLWMTPTPVESPPEGIIEPDPGSERNNGKEPPDKRIHSPAVHGTCSSADKLCHLVYPVS